MDQLLRRGIVALLTIAFVVGVALLGYGVVKARAAGGEPRQARAVVTPPEPSPGASARPETEHWTVGKVVQPVTAYVRPSVSARAKVKLATTTPNGFPTLVLVDTVRTVDGVTWYRVWLAMRPNGSRGWVREGGLGFFETRAKIVIDLSERALMVYRRGVPHGPYRVAVGRKGLETPTGFYFVNQKLKPPSPNGAYGVLAMGISAFQPKLPHWPQGGPVAIHGTNQPELIGQAVSHGCVRMRNRDIAEVGSLVPAGSPVIIRR